MALLDRSIPTHIATLRSKQGTPSREFLCNNILWSFRANGQQLKLNVIEVPVLAIFIATHNHDHGGPRQKLADIRLPAFGNRAIAQHKNATPRACKKKADARNQYQKFLASWQQHRLKHVSLLPRCPSCHATPISLPRIGRAKNTTTAAKMATDTAS